MSNPIVKALPVTLDGAFTVVRKRAAYLVLGATLLVGLALRLYGLNWDQGFLFHPDERAILMKVEGGLFLPFPIDFGQLFDPAKSPLNPHWFPYGSLPLYLLKFVGHLLSFIKQSYASQDLRLVGRAISAIFDMGTIFLVYLIGRKVYSQRVGLLGAAFVSLAVLHIQLSHFYAVDVMLAFFIVLTIYFCVRYAEHGRDRDLALMGVSLGLSLSTKVSMVPILATVVAALLIYALKEREDSSPEELQTRIVSSFNKLLVCLFIALVVFVMTEPFAILDRDTFLASITEQSEMVRRIRDYPYTRQYVDTAAYWYQISQLGEWGLGPLLGIVAWAGLAFAALAAVIRRGKGDLLLLSWILPYFAITGFFDVKFLRYLLPITPFLCLMGARMLFTLRDWAGELGKRWQTAGTVVIGAVIAATGFYALSYMNIYADSHTATRMSQWININVPKGALILKEHWEEGIPNLGAYRSSDLTLYENDDANKLNHIVTLLSRADYVVFFSNRLYGTIPRLPDRYPLTSRYYQLLFTGQLGYELVHYEATYPTLLGVSFVDDTFGRPKLPVPDALTKFLPSPISINGGYADESFTVYDHPKVMLFKKVKSLSDQELRALFSDVSPGKTSTQSLTKPGLLLSPADAKANQEGGTWSEIFDRDGFANRYPVLSWLLLVEAISIACFPIGVLLFRRFADRGYILTKSLGILLVAYLSWLFAATHLLQFSGSTIFFSLAIVAVFSAYLFYRYRADVVAFVRSRWHLLVLLEGIFLAAFFAFYLIRLANPDLWHAWRGGEKPMDFAFLNAVIKTTYFPPYDPWFSGGYLNYYYFGQVIVATLIKAVGIVPAVAYNLAVPLLFALTFAGAFSIGYDLRSSGLSSDRRGIWSWSGLLCGLFAAVLITVLGNLDGLLQIVDGLGKISNFDFQSTITGLSGTVNAGIGLWKAITDHQPLPAFDFWRSSRMMPGTINITEFPFFTFLFADLHAHLIGLPFTVLVIGTALVFALPEEGSPLGEGKRLFLHRYFGRLPWPLSSTLSWLSSAFPLPRLFPMLALALAFGATRVINSWDYPTYLILAVAAIFIGEFSKRGRISFATLFWLAVKAGLLFVLSSLLYRPFYDKYELFYTGIEPSAEKTQLQHYLAIHALFIFAVVSYLVLELKRLYGRTGFLRMSMLATKHWENLPHILALRKRLTKKADPAASIVAYGVVVAILVAAILALMQLYLIAFLFLILALAVPVGVGELSRKDATSPRNLFVLTLIFLAIALGIGVDFITIKGDVGRMNTVFKFYLQAWVLFGLASAFGLVAVLSQFAREQRKTRPGGTGGLGAVIGGYLSLPRWKGVWMAVLVALLLSVAIYPVAATRVRVQDRFQDLPPTDDGMAYMKSAVYPDEKGKIDLGYDYAAIKWMQDNVKGSPVIVEGYTPLYRWGSRVSIYTGLPTIIGWDWHETQQRWAYRGLIEARQKDVRDIYTVDDPALTLALLKKYNVKYVYVGEVERLYFGPQVNTKFEQMAGKVLEQVYQNQAVKIYEVK